MKKVQIVICLIIGLLIIIFSANLGNILANINIDGTTEMQFCTYFDNFSASFRLIGLIIILLPVFKTFLKHE